MVAEINRHSKPINFIHGHIEALELQGFYYATNGSAKKSLHYFSEALKLAKEHNRVKKILGALNLVARGNQRLGNYASSMDHLLQGIDLATAEKDSIMLSIMTENLGNLYLSQHDYTEALQYFKKVSVINDKIGDEEFSAQTKANLAYIYAKKGNYEKALNVVNESIKVLEKNNELNWLAFAYAIKANIYLEQKKYNWALHWYNQSETLHGKIMDNHAKIDVYNGLAKTYMGLNKLSIAKNYAENAFQTSKEISVIEGQKNCAKTLYDIHKKLQNPTEALGYHELYQQLSDTLSRDENQKSLGLLKTKMEYEKKAEALTLENEKTIAKQKGYIYLASILLIFFFIGFIIKLRVDRARKQFTTALAQKAGKLEKQEAKLREMNRTKDRLFSIIGHDLRSPIAAFQGILKLYRQSEISAKEFLQHVPKLSEDMGHISFTLNNLLSWGNTQMNGAVTKPTMVALENLVNENINLLSEIANNKSLQIINRLQPNTLTWSDANQIDVVIRNLISNALKFTPENGRITIDAVEHSEHWEVSVHDTGVGMDKATQEQLFATNSKITTYGTNNEKGTGLGLSLCKEMVKKNKGTIWVKSALNNGTCFYFTLPKSKTTYQNAG